MKRVALSLIVIIMIVFLPGCWDSRQVEEVAVLFGISIDKNLEIPGHITITLAGPTNQEDAEKPVRVISTSGKTVRNAMDNLQARKDRDVSLGHVLVVFIGRDVAEEGIEGKHLDGIMREPLVRGNAILATVDGRAQDLMESQTEDHPYIAIFLNSIIERAARRSLVPWYTLADYFQCLSIIGRDPMSPLIKLGPKGEVDPIVDNTAIYRGNKMVGELNQDETLILLMIKNNLRRGRISVPIGDKEDQYATILADRITRKVKTRVDGEDVFIHVHMKLTGEILELTAATPIADKESLEAADENVARFLEQKSYQVMNKLQKEFNSDPIGFGRYVNAYHNEFFQRINWREVYPNVHFTFEVDINLTRTGVLR